MADTITLYGIPNCDTVKKARKWLDTNGVGYEFHDYKKHGIDKTRLTRWSNELGWESLVNKRGTTWRKLPDADKQNLTQNKAITLMMDNTSLIKRPVVDTGEVLSVGFDETRYKSLFT